MTTLRSGRRLPGLRHFAAACLLSLIPLAAFQTPAFAERAIQGHVRVGACPDNASSTMIPYVKVTITGPGFTRDTWSQADGYYRLDQLPENWTGTVTATGCSAVAGYYVIHYYNEPPGCSQSPLALSIASDVTIEMDVLMTGGPSADLQGTVKD